MYNFDVERPTTIADAVKAMGQDEAQPISGGQTLIPTLKARLAQPSVLVSLGAVSEMQGVCTNDAGHLCIGGATTCVFGRSDWGSGGAQSGHDWGVFGQ